MVKYKPVESDVFSPKILVDNKQIIGLYTFSKMAQQIIDGTRGIYLW